MFHEKRRKNIRSSDAGRDPAHGHRAGSRRRSAGGRDCVVRVQPDDDLQVDQRAADKDGDEALHSTPATGRPRSLTPAQEQQVFRWVNGRDPRQYGLDFGLWTRAVVVQLIEQKFGIKLGLTRCRRVVGNAGADAAKAVAARLPARPGSDREMAARAVPGHCAPGQAAEGGRVLLGQIRISCRRGAWQDLGGGQTPVVERPGQRQSISTASAVSVRGGFWFCTDAGALNAELFVVLLRKMMRPRERSVHLVLDGLPAHKKACVREYVESTKGKLMLHCLPGYTPDLNPDELVWSHVKRTGVARRPLQKGEKLEQKSLNGFPKSRTSPISCAHSSRCLLSPISATAE